MTENQHINPGNYESWFLLYVDNELSEHQKKQVEYFVKENPHLKEELDALLATISVLDGNISFDKKEKLVKYITDDEISDEKLVLYLDGELSADEAEKIEKSDSDELQKRLNGLRRTYSTPDNSVVFTKKDTLYRQTKVVAMKSWLPRVAAAVVILAIGMWIFDNYYHRTENDIARGITGLENLGQGAQMIPIDTTAKREQAPEGTVTREDGFAQKGSDGKPTAGVYDAKAGKVADPVFPVSPKEPISVSASSETHLQNQSEQVFNTELQTSKTQVAISKTSESPVAKTPVQEDDAIASATAQAGRTRRGFFRNVSEKFKEKAIDILSDDNENINVAGLAINIKK